MHQFRGRLSVVGVIVIATAVVAQPAGALSLNDLTALQPVTQEVNTLDTLTAPVTKSIAPVTDQVTPVLGNVTQTVAPVTQALEPVTAPVINTVNQTTDALAPITTPVVTTVRQTGDTVVDAVVPPVVNIVAPVTQKVVTPTVTRVIAPLTSTVIAPVSTVVGAVGTAATPIVTTIAPVAAGSAGATVSPTSGKVMSNGNAGSPLATGGRSSGGGSGTAGSGISATAPVSYQVSAIPASLTRTYFFTPTRISTSGADGLPTLQRVTYKDLTPRAMVSEAIRNANTYGFPVGMLMVLIGFVLLNGRLDFRERKLRDAPWKRERRETVKFS